jgi:hypothetical protein
VHVRDGSFSRARERWKVLDWTLYAEVKVRVGQSFVTTKEFSMPAATKTLTTHQTSNSEPFPDNRQATKDACRQLRRHDAREVPQGVHHQYATFEMDSLGSLTPLQTKPELYTARDSASTISGVLLSRRTWRGVVAATATWRVSSSSARCPTVQSASS